MLGRGLSCTALAALLAIAVGSAAGGPVAAQPGSDAAPLISPNGAWLLFDRYYGGSRYSEPDSSLRIARPDGTAERELVARTRSVQGRWTPGNLIQVRYATGETVLLRPEDGAVAGRLSVTPSAWSPDGSWIAYVGANSRELYVSHPDGSEARVVAEAPELGGIGAGSFSPDSSRLTYGVFATGNDRSEVVGIDGAHRIVLKDASVAAPGIWSPDGASVVLMVQNDRPGHYRPPRVWVMAPDGTGARTVSPGFGSSPDWSPRGDWIVYLRQTSTKRRDVYDLVLVHPDGSGLRAVVRTNGSGATWAPDGRHLLAVGDGRCRRSGILEIDAFARTVKRLTNRCRIQGTPGPDHLRGAPLRDLLYGLGGDDTIAGAGGDDAVYGGPGNDVLRVRSGGRDFVDCGPGRDRVFADRRYRIARTCELVER